MQCFKFCTKGQLKQKRSSTHHLKTRQSMNSCIATVHHSKRTENTRSWCCRLLTQDPTGFFLLVAWAPTGNTPTQWFSGWWEAAVKRWTDGLSGPGRWGPRRDELQNPEEITWSYCCLVKTKMRLLKIQNPSKMRLVFNKQNNQALNSQQNPRFTE